MTASSLALRPRVVTPWEARSIGTFGLDVQVLLTSRMSGRQLDACRFRAHLADRINHFFKAISDFPSVDSLVLPRRSQSVNNVALTFQVLRKHFEVDHE